MLGNMLSRRQALAHGLDRFVMAKALGNQRGGRHGKISSIGLFDRVSPD
jgi:hypothetical protein